MKGSPAILLDRDGTIIVERHYLADPDLVELEAGAAEGLRRMAAAGYVLAVVTNQSGVGRGYFDMAAVQAVNDRVSERLREQGVRIEGWFVCPHVPGENCDCRKPRPGLARQAEQALGLDLARSWVIGDKPSDVGLATAVGARGLLVADDAGPASVSNLMAAADTIQREDAHGAEAEQDEEIEQWR